MGEVFITITYSKSPSLEDLFEKSQNIFERKLRGDEKIWYYNGVNANVPKYKDERIYDELSVSKYEIFNPILIRNANGLFMVTNILFINKEVTTIRIGTYTNDKFTISIGGLEIQEETFKIEDIVLIDDYKFEIPTKIYYSNNKTLQIKPNDLFFLTISNNNHLLSLTPNFYAMFRAYDKENKNALVKISMINNIPSEKFKDIKDSFLYKNIELPIWYIYLFSNYYNKKEVKTQPVFILYTTLKQKGDFSSLLYKIYNYNGSSLNVNEFLRTLTSTEKEQYDTLIDNKFNINSLQELISFGYQITVKKEQKEKEEKERIEKEKERIEKEKERIEEEKIKKEKEEKEKLELSENKKKRDEERTSMDKNIKKYNPPYKKIKIVILGDEGVGKTSFINQYVNNKFNENFNPNKDLKSYERNIIDQNEVYTLNIWDPEIIKGISVENQNFLWDDINFCIIMADISNKNTIESVEKYIDNCIDNTYDILDHNFIVIFNKDDLNNKNITNTDISTLKVKLKNKLNADIFLMLVSAKNYTNIDEVFQKIIERISYIFDSVQDIPYKQEKLHAIRTHVKNLMLKTYKRTDITYEEIQEEILRIEERANLKISNLTALSTNLDKTKIIIPENPDKKDHFKKLWDVERKKQDEDVLTHKSGSKKSTIKIVILGESK